MTAYKTIGHNISDFFARSGGWGALVRSPYVHISLALTLVCYGAWRNGKWSDLPIAVLPALLGFTLAAYALLLAFGDEQFRAFLANCRDDGVEPNAPAENALLSVSAIFLQFVVIQAVALLFAIIGHSHPIGTLFPQMHSTVIQIARNIFSCMGYFLFMLSISLSIAAGINIYHTTRWYVDFSRVIEYNAKSVPQKSDAVSEL
jgi:hypothetical protein